jgi:hypothetical protein
MDKMDDKMDTIDNKMDNTIDNKMDNKMDTMDNKMEGDSELVFHGEWVLVNARFYKFWIPRSELIKYNLTNYYMQFPYLYNNSV